MAAALAAVAGAATVQAQAFTTLYDFTGLYEPDFINADGSHPFGLTLSGATLYGVAGIGGGANKGTVYKLNTDGTGFTVLHTFTGGADGSNPQGRLVLSGTTLYGVAQDGGAVGNGTLYKVETDGSAFTTLYSFPVTVDNGNFASTNSDGAHPSGAILSGSVLYGTALNGSLTGNGTVYAFDTVGAAFTPLYSFNGYDGATPVGELLLMGSSLYGVTYTGANGQNGTVFTLQTDGTGFATLHNFAGGAEGYRPNAGLVASGNVLYGTTFYGGPSGWGTVFSLQTDGAAFATLHSFNFSDGGGPEAPLTLSGTNLYGTTYIGGGAGNGTVFVIDTTGATFSTLHDFHGYPIEGGSPHAGVVLSGHTLYGTTESGGNTQQGAVFGLELPSNCAPAVLTVAQYAGITVVGTPGCDYQIQYTTSLTDPVTWTPLTTITLTGPVELYIDTTVPAGNRFYQAVAQ